MCTWVLPDIKETRDNTADNVVHAAAANDKTEVETVKFVGTDSYVPGGK